MGLFPIFMLGKIFSEPIRIILRYIFSLTGNMPVAIIIFSVIFTLLYACFDVYKTRISVRNQIAGHYANKFKDFASEPSVFDDNLTNIYKKCKVNQLSLILLNILGYFIFIQVINMIYTPLNSVYGFGDGQRAEILNFLIKNYKISESASDFEIINTIFNNIKDISQISGVPQYIYSITNSGISLFNINCLMPATFDITIIFPILLLITYLKNAIYSIKNAIKSKTNKAYALMTLNLFFLISIVSAVFIFPIVYFIFIFTYKLINVLLQKPMAKYKDKYVEVIGKQVVSECDAIYNKAKNEFEDIINKNNCEEKENDDSNIPVAVENESDK